MNENVRVCREVPTRVWVNPATSTLSPLFFSNVGIRLSDYDASYPEDLIFTRQQVLYT